MVNANKQEYSIGDVVIYAYTDSMVHEYIGMLHEYLPSSNVNKQAYRINDGIALRVVFKHEIRRRATLVETLKFMVCNV